MKFSLKQYPELRKKTLKMDIPDLLRHITCPDITAGKDEIPEGQTCFFIHPAEMEKAREIARAVNDGKKEKTLLVADMEYGAGNALKGATAFPSMWAAARAKDPELAYLMGAVTAKEGLSAGYHWTFGPCVDILGNRENPIVSVRCAGDGAETVLKYAGAYFKGVRDGGMIATLKHFPGDGFCSDDQHITTPENPLSKDEWDASFGRVYSELIEEGAPAVMPGHISLPCCDEPDGENGLYPPATLSKRVLTGLLREKLGFEGVIVSDALIMGGFCNYINLYDGIARFLEAGGDCLLFTAADGNLCREMKKRVENGQLKLKTLQNAAYRMLCFSKQYFEDAEKREKIRLDEAECKRIARLLTEKSVETVRDRAGLLPIKDPKSLRVLHVVLSIPGTPESAFERTNELTGRFKAAFASAVEVRDPGGDNIRKAVQNGECDLVICSVHNRMSYGLNNVKLAGPVARNMMHGWMRYGVPAVFISLSDPFFGETFKAAADTVINTYGYNEYTADAVLERLLKGPARA
ncbi:MAG: hypothetical protein IJS65_00500 [Clostridia bacterium]|nr:hypothetical protein [Clostridia bacterium]